MKKLNKNMIENILKDIGQLSKWGKYIGAQKVRTYGDLHLWKQCKYAIQNLEHDLYTYTAMDKKAIYKLIKQKGFDKL